MSDTNESSVRRMEYIREQLNEDGALSDAERRQLSREYKLLYEALLLRSLGKSGSESQ